MEILVTILIILGVLIILLFIALIYVYWMVFYTPHKKQNNDYNIYDNPIYEGYHGEAKALIDRVREIPYEDIYTFSKDKKKLHARLLRKEGSKRIAICCHGYHGTAYRDFSGGGSTLYELGYNVLLIDERGHGTSEGHSITFGKREQYDFLCWIKKMKEIVPNYESIALIGISMGGASVLMASNKVDKEVKIIADCPYNRIKDILNENVRSLGLKPKLIYPLIWLAGLLFVHININKGSALESVKESKCRFLIIHGTNDKIVPHHYSEDIYLACQDRIQYELFIGAAHGMSFLVDTSRYINLVKEFLNS